MKKRVDERFVEDLLWWFGHVKTMKKDRVAKRAYVEECAGIRSVGMIPCRTV